MRQRMGQDIRFKGETLRAFVSESVPGKTGTVALPQGLYGPMVAAFEPVLFDLSPQDFAPNTGRVTPVEGEYFEWMTLWHRLTRVTFENIDTDTISILAYGYRDITYTPPGGTTGA